MSAQIVAKRVATDQLVFAPFMVASTMGMVKVMDGDPKGIPQLLKAEWFKSLVANWALWVPAQCINFGLVPAHLQVLFANMVALVWNAILSHFSHQ